MADNEAKVDVHDVQQGGEARAMKLAARILFAIAPLIIRAKSKDVRIVIRVEPLQS